MTINTRVVDTKIVNTKIVNTKIVKALMGFNEMTIPELAEVLGQSRAYTGAKLNGNQYGVGKHPTFNDSDVEKMANYFKYNAKVFYLDDVEIAFEAKNFNTSISNRNDKEHL